MRSTSRFTSQVRTLGVIARVAMGLSVGLLSSTAFAESTHVDLGAARAAARVSINPQTGDAVEHVGVCAGNGRFHCFARAVTRINGRGVSHAAVMGTTAATIQKAYGITDLTQGAGATVAIVDAYGYSALEKDLATYRTQMGLPACTTANGCLTIVNQTGGTTPPANPPASDDWTVETALDVDMASAACPACKILVVQATTPDDLEVAEMQAAKMTPTVISNSWGGPEQGTELGAEEANFNHPGIGIFVAAGDDGYNDNGEGPDYPGTSAYAISVGATSLTTASTTRGYTETTWGGKGTAAYSSAQITNTGAGGSACSKEIAKPSYQPANTQCTYKATADVSALGDPATGPAIYDSQAASPETPGWIQIGGTSASSPLVAAMMAASGNGNITGKFFYDNEAKFNDVTSGTNGSCANILCVAGTGWDGPTGVGTPNVALVKNTGGTGAGITVAISSPSDGAQVGEGFEVDTTVSAGVVKADLFIDGTQVDETDASPFNFATPTTLALGAHMVQVTGYDASGNMVQSTQVAVTVTTSGDGGGGDGDSGDPTGTGTPTGGANGVTNNDVLGGCAAGGSGAGFGGVLLALGLAASRRRRAA
jgi:hypothetical protein